MCSSCDATALSAVLYRRRFFFLWRDASEKTSVYLMRIEVSIVIMEKWKINTAKNTLNKSSFSTPFSCALHLQLTTFVIQQYEKVRVFLQV